MTRINVEFHLIGTVSQDALADVLVLIVVRFASLGFFHFLAQGEIRTVLLLNHIDGDVDVWLCWWGGGCNRETHRDVEEVLAVQRHAPNKPDVLLCGRTEIIHLCIERHWEESKKEQNSRNSEVEEDIPSCLGKALFSFVEGQFLQQFVLVLVRRQCSSCIKFLFAHETPISSEHFKGASCSALADENRW